MELGTFWLDLDVLTSKPQAHPDIKVVLCTLDAEYPVHSVELTQDGEGQWQLQINSEEGY